MMHQDFAAHCDHLFSWDPQRTLVVGCSGGIDSVVLAHLVHQYHGSMVLAHLNYGLRGDQSDQDEAFVRDLAQELGCAVAVKRADPSEIKDRPGHSVQMMARDMRYAFFEEVRAAHKA
ncbi:MAG: ATP-binding protein, partial [Flavobacteriaceae bacterium]